MSNYKWVTNSYNGQPTKGYTHLRNEDFTPILYPSVPCYELDELLEKELTKRGIRIELCHDAYDIYEMTRAYRLIPNDIVYATITAPLYKENQVTGEYEKVADSFTKKAIDPMQKQWVKEEYQRCQQAVEKAQAERFKALFGEKSLDGGLTACIDITFRIQNLNGIFCEKYLTNDFFKIASLMESSLTGPNGTETAIFIREMDAKGGTVTIRVPERFKGLVIGSGGRNIKGVAQAINAKRINVKGY